jgi:hypothetical protein
MPYEHEFPSIVMPSANAVKCLPTPPIKKEVRQEISECQKQRTRKHATSGWFSCKLASQNVKKFCSSAKAKLNFIYYSSLLFNLRLQ